MKKIYGISLSFSSFEKGLWFDHDEREYQPEGWGIRLHLAFGRMIRPVPKFWIKDNNPWKGDEPWFVIRIPYMIGPFLSLAFGSLGIYLGFKTFQVKTKHISPTRYGKWMKSKEFGTDKNPAEYLQLTASTRKTRWK